LRQELDRGILHRLTARRQVEAMKVRHERPTIAASAQV